MPLINNHPYYHMVNGDLSIRQLYYDVNSPFNASEIHDLVTYDGNEIKVFIYEWVLSASGQAWHNYNNVLTTYYRILGFESPSLMNDDLTSYIHQNRDRFIL